MVIGPGMGRGEGMIELTRQILLSAKARNVGVVLDADALWMVAQQPSMLAGLSR